MNTKTTKMRRLLCAGGAAMLALTGPVASAASVKDLAEATLFEYAGKVETGTIQVTMNTTGVVYVNPYQIEVPVFGEDATVVNSTDKVISPTQFIINESNTGLNVSITPTITSESGVEIVKSSDIGSATKKSVSVGFEIQEVTDDQAEPTWTATAIDIGDPDAQETLVDTTVEIPRGDSAPKYAAFRVKGDAVSAPVKDVLDSDGQPTGDTVADPWTSDDSVTASIAFTFTPTGGAGGTTPTPGAVTASIDDSGFSSVGGTTAWDGSSATLTVSLTGGNLSDYSIAWTCDDNTVTVTNNTTATASFEAARSSPSGAKTMTVTLTPTAGGATITKTVTITLA